MDLVKYEKKDITDIAVGIIGHGVNARGKMGAGVAQAIAEKWPIVKQRYLQLFELPRAHRELGSIQIVKISPTLYVLNMFTQERYGHDGQFAVPDAIYSCVEWAIITASEHRLPLYMPKIGCGLGGLNWDTTVRPIIEGLASEHKYPVTIVEL
jgi:O-acetyl-ADP-ribose deacetylase (regulator of RNase III)